MNSAAPDAVNRPEESTRSANLALGLDAAFCNVVGLVFTLTGAFMADWLGVAGWVATLFGVLILFWSFVVTLFANRKVARRSELEFVARANAVAVVAAILVIVIPDTMTSAGKTTLAVGAAVTALFALAQLTTRPSR